ncbi:acyltransferase family protein [Phnomibacter ginsenosidimutans]|uniref:Acyltransferase family protein n=1 Tax=Phnomibacter ginsenosidimutans TaxID=2676868 RepID=A0A6I6GAN0_9BACT|nr:acyltransferase [Phnomibacter ginsenosidimutans]QGW29707.1 acyltransferase family protein [Phnomibacter ginsenosidimutans]
MQPAPHHNNFDFIRLLLASFVIITHSYALLGLPEHDGLWQWSGGNVAFSTLGVNGFFIVSGYLVCQSLERSASIASYLRKRALRIFPGLLLALLFSWALAWLHFNGPGLQFLAQADSWTFIPRNMLLLWPQYSIEGSFQELPAAHRGEINGSLWTLGYEWLMYLCLLPLFWIRRAAWRKVVPPIIIIGLLALMYTDNHWRLPQWGSIQLSKLTSLGTYFLAGASLHVLGFGKRLKWLHLLITIGLLMASIHFHQYFIMQYLLWPVIIIGIAQQPAWRLTRFIQQRGDLSYGIYLLAFPVQQTLVSQWPNLTPGMLAGLSWLLVLPLAYASWHLVEKPALRWKQPAIQQQFKPLTSNA